VNGKFTVIQIADYHPDHNEYVKKVIEDFSAEQGWELDRSDMAAFLSGADVYQKMLAMSQAGDPPDLMIHTGLSSRNLHFLQVAEPVTDVVEELIKMYGKVMPGPELSHHFENEWWAVPFYGRVGGYWARKDLFEAVGVNIDTDFEDFGMVAEACLKVSDPDNKIWGWGMTVNRSGDGASLVWNSIHQWGGALQDESGEIVTLNSPETIEGVGWLADIYMNPKWEKMIPQGVNAWTDPTNNENFLAGTIAFTQNAGTMYAKAVFDKVPFAEHIKVIRTPKGLGPKATRLEGAGAGTFHLFKGVKNRDAATATIMKLMEIDSQHFIWKASAGYVIPPYKNLWEDPVVREVENNVRFEPVAWNEPPFSGVAWRAKAPSPATDAVDKDNIPTDMIGQILQGKSVEEAVMEAHTRAVRIFQDFGLKGE